MVLHNNCCRSSVLVEDGAKIKLRRSKSNCIHRKTTKNVELDWKHLISSCHLDRDAHCKLFELILWRVFVLFNEILLTGLQD